jgi:putative sigma-54 modulation protein
MGIEITGRHIDVTDSMREYAGKRLTRLVEEFPRIEKVHLILDVQRYLHTAEAVLHARRHIQLEARECSEDMYASIDRVVDKIEKQLRRHVDKIIGRKEHGKVTDLEREVRDANAKE